MTRTRRDAAAHTRGDLTRNRAQRRLGDDGRAPSTEHRADRSAPSSTRAPTSGALAAAAALGPSALAGVLVGAQDGVTIVDTERRFLYANPAACVMLGSTLQQLRGRDFLGSIAARERASISARVSDQRDDPVGTVPTPFTCNLLGPDGVEREIVCSAFDIEVAGSHCGVAIFQDLTDSRAAARAAAALAQSTAQLVRAGTTTDEILAGIARHAVDETRALACGISVVGEDHNLASAGGYGPGYGTPPVDAEAGSDLWSTLADHRGEDVIAAITAGSIVIGQIPGKPVVLPDARSAWETDPVIQGFAAGLEGVDWQAGVYVGLSWENRGFGLFAVYLPTGVVGPTEAELAFYTALADQAAVVVTNARLNAQARQSAAASERARLARELHDSVSQGLFSMTMHARAAQVSMAQAGVDEDGALGLSIAELAALTRGALAEMRALLFELRPAALAEEGLVAALRKQAAALTARERLMITVDGPEQRLALGGGVEEHLYRIASEALRNAINHAGAERVNLSLVDDADRLRMEVHDDGAGFDPQAAHPGHLGLSTMAERAAMIGGELAVASTPGNGTTVVVSVPIGHEGQRTEGPVGGREAAIADFGHHAPAPTGSPERGLCSDREQPTQGGTSDEPERASGLGESSTLADAAALGVPTLAAVLAGAPEAIAIADADRRWVYANPAACQLLGRPLEQLRGQDFLTSVPVRERGFVIGRFLHLLGGTRARFGSVLIDVSGEEHETVHSISATEIAGCPHAVAIFRDVTGARAAARAAAALTQASSQLVGAGTTIGEVLAGIARHAVEGTRAVACEFEATGSAEGGYGPAGPTHGEDRAGGWVARADIPVADRIRAFTAGSIAIGEIAGKPVVLPDARSVWEADPSLKGFVATMGDWRGAAVFLPLAWESRVIGWVAVFLPSGVPGPSEAELAFYTALADQAAVAVTNVRLASEARQAAALVERSRLARELHDSVSQGLFSMTMHARAAQLAMVHTGLVQDGALGQSIADLAQLARGAMAEMRALIFELRPAALAEEGLVAALCTQAAALSAREATKVTAQGPEERLDLPAEVEEHLYRIASEALHNVINHADAESATVSVINRGRELRVEVRDDGAGFDQDSAHPGHLGLATMAERAETIGAALAVTSAPGAGTSVVLSLPR